MSLGEIPPSGHVLGKKGDEHCTGEDQRSEDLLLQTYSSQTLL